MAALSQGTPPTATQTHQRLVITDPVAFRLLEEDPSTTVITRREVLTGYECYLVEQWACSRTDPTFMITSYTGDEKSKVYAGVLGVPADESKWGNRLKVFYQSLSQYHARKKVTPLGTIMVTNLSGLPSSLTVIPIPEGDAKGHRQSFFVNENLKRLGCAGRIGLTLGKPSSATSAKFYQLYKASDKIPLEAAVIELVKLCQVALVLFGKLDAEYADGLLCDVTEKAITDWWVEFGTEYYSVEPHDGILGPTTVSALLGLLMGARNRLHAYGAPVSKDVFDIESTKRGIAYFQKGHRLPKSRRFDRATLARIHRSTAKAASGEGWFVPRAVKGAVAELGGKGGEMVMDMVGASNKTSIAEIETIDIEQFVHQVSGSRAKWLWQGKPRKATAIDSSRDNNELKRTPTFPKQPSSDWLVTPQTPAGKSSLELGDERERGKLVKRHPEKSASTKNQDSSRGLGRIKDAVGRRHATKVSRDESSRPDVMAIKSGIDVNSTTLISQTSAQMNRNDISAHPLSDVPPITNSAETKADTQYQHSGMQTPNQGEGLYMEHHEPSSEVEGHIGDVTTSSPYVAALNRSSSPSIAGSTYRGIDLQELFVQSALPGQKIGHHFQRTQSFIEFKEIPDCGANSRWARHLSFSLAEDAVLTWERLGSPDAEGEEELLAEIANAEQSRKMRELLHGLETNVAHWVRSELRKVEDYHSRLDQDQEDLDQLYGIRAEDFKQLESGSKEAMAFERTQLEESAKEVEVLGARLEYEINLLRGKVEDVEDGVTEFERQVNAVEDRVAELQKSMQPKETWLSWLMQRTGLANKSARPGSTVDEKRD